MSIRKRVSSPLTVLATRMPSASYSYVDVDGAVAVGVGGDQAVFEVPFVEDRVGGVVDLADGVAVVVVLVAGRRRRPSVSVSSRSLSS